MSESRNVLYHHRIRADDGQAVHVRELITAMRAAGHHVDECALVPKAIATEPVARAAAADDKPGFWQRLSLPRTAVEVLEVVYNQKGRSMLRAAAKRQRPDFIYERHALHLRAGLDVAREIGVPLLLEVNSPMVVEMQKLGKLSLPKRARRTEQHVLQNADAVLAVTDVLKDILVDAGAPRERVHVIGNGAVPERYGDDAKRASVAVRQHLHLPKDAFALAFVGYMRPWHRLDLVLEIMTRPTMQSLVLVLMGEGPALEPLQEQAKQLGLQDRLRVLGVVPKDLLPAHVMATDGALIPAINDYASPLKLFDSLCAGVATLAPDQPNLRENLVDGENGLLFEPGNADNLHAQLQRLVSDREFAARVGAAGRQSLHDNRWTWAGNADRVMAVFDSLTATGVAR